MIISITYGSLIKRLNPVYFRAPARMCDDLSTHKNVFGPAILYLRSVNLRIVYNIWLTHQFLRPRLSSWFF